MDMIVFLLPIYPVGSIFHDGFVLANKSSDLATSNASGSTYCSALNSDVRSIDYCCFGYSDGDLHYSC